MRPDDPKTQTGAPPNLTLGGKPPGPWVEQTLARLRSETAAARGQLADMRRVLEKVRALVAEVRAALEGDKNRLKVTESTPGAGQAQGEAG